MKIKYVTFTGIDRQTDLSRLERLQRQYGFAEFGILYSHKWREKGERYPEPAFIREVAKHGRLNLSIHLCGTIARQMLEGEVEAFYDSIGCDWPVFNRHQLNIAVSDFENKTIKQLQDIRFHNTIIQVKSEDVCRKLLERVDNFRISYLVDPSGGKGLESSFTHVKSEKNLVGYAGGITPENVGQKIFSLISNDSDQEFWIDMESRVRTNNKFDIDKVEQVLKTVSKYVTK